MLLWMTNCKPTNICLFKGTNRNARKRSKICSKLTVKAPERRHRLGRLTLTEHISDLSFSSVSIVNFEQVNVCWEAKKSHPVCVKHRNIK